MGWLQMALSVLWAMFSIPSLEKAPTAMRSSSHIPRAAALCVARPSHVLVHPAEGVHPADDKVGHGRLVSALKEEMLLVRMALARLLEVIVNDAQGVLRRVELALG